GDQQSTDLVIVGNNNEMQTLASKLSGLIAFSWSPDGSKVAYVENSGSLLIVDAQSAQIIAQSSVSGVYAFFWSPDSKRIAYITLAAAPNTFNAYEGNDAKVAALVQDVPGLTWSVIDVETGATRRYGSFMPTDEMVYLLSFF